MAERSGSRLVSGVEIEELSGGKVGENKLAEARLRSFFAERSGSDGSAELRSRSFLAERSGRCTQTCW